MFQKLLRTLRTNISAVRSIIKTNDRLRDIAFGNIKTATQKSTEYPEFFSEIMQDIPKEREWQVYDQCSVLTRLYAIYERFVEDLVRDWLRLLPRLFPCYSDLEERIRNTYQTGVGRLLLDLKKNRYEHLSIEKVVGGLFRGVSEEEYELLPDAFLFHEQNLRREALEKLLADAGIDNAWSWVEKHRFFKELNLELNELISYRNDAAHGSPIENLLGSSTLLEFCDFIEALCQALAELVTYQVIRLSKRNQWERLV